MANQVYAGFVFNNAGVAVEGATVELFPRNTTTTATTSTTTNSSGYWTMSTSTEGRFDVRITNGSSIRFLKYDDEIQVTTLEVANLNIRNPADTFDYSILPAAIAADRTLTLPLITGTDTLVTLGLAQTFTGALTFAGITLGGAVIGGDQAFTAVGDMTFTSGSLLRSGSTNTNTLLIAANDTTFITLTTGATDTMALGAWTASGAIDFASENMTNVDIDSGAIDGTAIGAASAAAGTFTDIVGTSLILTSGQMELNDALHFDTDVADPTGSVTFISRSTTGSGRLHYNVASGNEHNFFVNGGEEFSISAAGIVVPGGDAVIAAGHLQLSEVSAPGAGGANTARIYAVVDGGSLTDLEAVFQDGTTDVFAQEV